MLESFDGELIVGKDVTIACHPNAYLGARKVAKNATPPLRNDSREGGLSRQDFAPQQMIPQKVT